ncbi:hypothetical protein OA970_01050 [Alphaproteobacteria bacterium]|nr:hypothetical protein [Alphaproteobacteria bacterium]
MSNNVNLIYKAVLSKPAPILAASILFFSAIFEEIDIFEISISGISNSFNLTISQHFLVLANSEK